MSESLSSAGIAVADKANNESHSGFDAEWIVPSVDDVASFAAASDREGTHERSMQPESTSDGNHGDISLAAPVRLRPSSTSIRRFTILQQWEGVVDEVGEDSFTAHLRDLTEPDSPLEFAEIPILGNISPIDRALLLPGQVFYWSLGHEIRPPCQVVNASQIRFRRVAQWSASSMRRLNERARALEEQFGSNENAAGF